MQKYHLLYLGLGLIALMWVLNLVALHFYLYWTVGWYDIMMHFLGGFAGAVCVIGCVKFQNKSLWSFLFVFLSVMIVGIAFEIFEYVNDLTYSTQNYPLDTTLDLVMDAVGAITAYFSFITLPGESQ